jgi:tetratricopeptide (TPR) repeat protein
MFSVKKLFNIEWDVENPAILRRGLFVVGILTLLVRLAYYVELSGKPYFGVPVLDSRWWLQDAQSFLATGSFGAHALFRPPFYSLLLAGTLKLVGSHASLLMPLIQLLLGAVFCVCVALLAASCANPAAGIAAGCLAALNAPLVFYEGELLPDSLSILFLVLFLVFWVHGIREKRAFYWGLSGLSAGLASLTRATAFPIGVVFAFGLLWKTFRRSPDRCSLVHMVAFVLPFAVLVAVPTGYNLWWGEPVVICGQGGINFYLGNNSEANGVNVILPRVSEQSNHYRDTVEEYAMIGFLAQQYGWSQAKLRYEAGERASLSSVDRYWYSKGFSFLFSDLPNALKLYLKKIVALTNNYEPRNNRDFQLARKYESMVLQLLPVSFSLVFALAAHGLLWIRRMGRPEIRWIVLYLVVSSAIVLAYFVAGRLRLLIMPAMFVLAGIGLERFAFVLSKKQVSDIVRDAVVMGIAGFISCSPWPHLDFRYSSDQIEGDGIRATSFPAGEFAMLANASIENGHPHEALEYARAAVTSDPNFAYGWLVYGNALSAIGKWEEALAAYTRGLETEPQSSRLRNNLAVVLEKLGKFQEAAEVYLDVLNTNPADARANANLGLLLYRCGDKAAARTFARIALETSPEDSVAKAILGELDAATSSPQGGRSNELTTILQELATPLPVRVDLTSSRTLQQILTMFGKTIEDTRKSLVGKSSKHARSW